MATGDNGRETSMRLDRSVLFVAVAIPFAMLLFADIVVAEFNHGKSPDWVTRGLCRFDWFFR